MGRGFFMPLRTVGSSRAAAAVRWPVTPAKGRRTASYLTLASRAQIPNGTYNLIDKDGFHYAPFDGLKVVKTTDGNDPKGKLRVAKGEGPCS
jgi:hypothetical protein